MILNVSPRDRILTNGMLAADVMDRIPLLNILVFGLCQNPADPAAAAITAAVLGVLMPMSCTPAAVSPQIPDGPPTLLLGGMPALDTSGMLVYTQDEVIKISVPGQVQMLIL